jgi:hypothetical protein
MTEEISLAIKIQSSRIFFRDCKESMRKARDLDAGDDSDTEDANDWHGFCQMWSCNKRLASDTSGRVHYFSERLSKEIAVTRRFCSRSCLKQFIKRRY